MVEETLEPGASVARVASARSECEPGIRVATAVSLYQQGLLEGANGKAAGLLPVHVVETPAVQQAVRPRSASGTTPWGLIQVELPKGQLRINETKVPRFFIKPLIPFGDGDIWDHDAHHCPDAKALVN